MLKQASKGDEFLRNRGMSALIYAFGAFWNHFPTKIQFHFLVSSPGRPGSDEV